MPSKDAETNRKKNRRHDAKRKTFRAPVWLDQVSMRVLDKLRSKRGHTRVDYVRVLLAKDAGISVEKLRPDYYRVGPRVRG
jgi:hypothetical protein